MSTVTIVTTFYVGICTYIEACVDDLSTIVDRLNETAEMYLRRRGSNQIQLTFRRLMGDMIELHIDSLR